MILVMKPLKKLALPLESCVASKPLSAKEPVIIGIIKTFHGPVSPGLSNRDEDRLDAVIET